MRGEFARHVLAASGVNSTEFDPMQDEAVISELPEQKKIEQLGGSMRLGGQDVDITPNSIASHLYEGATSIRERFRHRYEVEPEFIDRLESAGLHFSGRHPEHPIMQVLELNASAHPYFLAAQYHPELTSRPLRPQPLFMGLMAAALRKRYPEADVGRWIAPASGPSVQMPKSPGKAGPTSALTA